jgi:phosphomannomutase
MSVIRAYTHKYDIRGSVSNKFGPNEAYYVGRGFAAIVQQLQDTNKTVIVGWDARDTSTGMAQHLMRGLAESGIDVIEVGLATTPMVRFAAVTYPSSGSIMVTASHNNLNDNGFKFTLNGKPFYDQSLQKLCDIIESKEFIDGEGSITPVQIGDLYRESILKRVRISDKVKVVWVARNGVILNILENLLQALPGQHLISSDLRDIKYFKHDVIFDFDTDADRMMMIDSTGRQWHGDEVLAVFSLGMSRAIKNLKVVFDLKASHVLVKWLQSRGIECHICRVGSCFIDERMREVHAHLGGETSGHFLFYDYHGFSDDGIYSALLMLNYLSEVSINLQDIRELLPPLYISTSIQIPCKDNNKRDIFKRLTGYIKQQNLVLDESLEGSILVKQTEGWYVVRISETENSLSVRCEGFNKNGLHLVEAKAEEALSMVGLSLW